MSEAKAPAKRGYEEAMAASEELYEKVTALASWYHSQAEAGDD